MFLRQVEVRGEGVGVGEQGEVRGRQMGRQGRAKRGERGRAGAGWWGGGEEGIPCAFAFALSGPPAG